MSNESNDVLHMCMLFCASARVSADFKDCFLPTGSKRGPAVIVVALSFRGERCMRGSWL